MSVLEICGWQGDAEDGCIYISFHVWLSLQAVFAIAEVAVISQNGWERSRSEGSLTCHRKGSFKCLVSHSIRSCICAWRCSNRSDSAELWHAEFISIISFSSECSQELHPPHRMHEDWVSVCQWTTGCGEDSSFFILLQSLACLMILSTRGDTMPSIVVIFMTWTSV